MKKGKKMEKVVLHIKKTWKAYVVGIWMIGVTGFLFYLSGETQAIKQASTQLNSNVGSIESILISTDNNVAEVKIQVEKVASQMKSVHKRVMRRR
jgi:hypothetical protein